jgi:hypothetical protein
MLGNVGLPLKMLVDIGNCVAFGIYLRQRITCKDFPLILWLDSHLKDPIKPFAKDPIPFLDLIE